MRYEHTRITLAMLAGLAMLGATACDTGTESDQQAATEREETSRDSGMAADTTQQGQEQQAMEQSGEGVALTVEESSEYGEYIADVQGRPVYMLEAGEDAGSGMSGQTVSQQGGEGMSQEQGGERMAGQGDSATECTDECLQQWPPVLAQVGRPMAQDPAIDESKLDTIQREDGQQQVTYNGHPLYYYIEDSGAGEPTGQEVRDQWGEWYLLTAEGEPLESGQAQPQGASRK